MHTNKTKLNENSVTKEEFYYDSVTIPLKIKNHSFSFKLSKNRFLKLKNISEKDRKKDLKIWEKLNKIVYNQKTDLNFYLFHKKIFFLL